MPGTHTFYDGSELLQPVSDIFGVGVDKVNLVTCQFLSLPLAFLQYTVFTPNRVSPAICAGYQAIIGLIFCYFCFGSAIKHLLLLVTLSYAIMHLSPRQIVHRSVFIFAMGYLLVIHWYRCFALSSYYLDVTGPMMVLVQKITVLAFSLHDGTAKKSEELNDLQKREALKSVPSFSNFMSYMFHFQAVLTGPMCFYTDYKAWIEGTSAIGKDGKIEKPWSAVLTKLSQAAIFFLVYFCFADHLTPDIIMNMEYMNLNWPLRLLVIYIVTSFQRLSYYFAWTLADAIFNLSGFGFSGYDEDKNPQWDLVSNVKPWQVETASNLKETLEAWNCCTMYWLRRVAYDRAPKKYRTLCTYLLSAVWHGFFLGYYVTFLTGALFTVSARTVRRCLRWRFQGNQFSRFFYDVVTFIVTRITLSYTVYPFIMLHFGPGLHFYRHMYFCFHIIALLILFILPQLLPPKTIPVDYQNTINHAKKSY
ncbi:unnamed protein product [Thelazia callipaeda]|uniref:Lysophospholipid acyltransferase 1-like n=1 Tax=Thelazia callipaeda TaxID=103827 RepID=A0A0N5CPB1_THECL|nr:unnamed protein product [Thelazia callipaeda]